MNILTIYFCRYITISFLSINFIISLLFPQLVEILPLGLHVDLLVHDVNVARYRLARVIRGKNVVLTVEYMKAGSPVAWPLDILYHDSMVREKSLRFD